MIVLSRSGLKRSLYEGLVLKSNLEITHLAFSGGALQYVAEHLGSTIP